MLSMNRIWCWLVCITIEAVRVPSPKNRPLAWQGSWTDPKTKKTHSYKFDAVLEVAGGPTRSPYDPQFNPKSINRIEAIGDDIKKTLDRLDKAGTRFVPPATK